MTKTVFYRPATVTVGKAMPAAPGLPGLTHLFPASPAGVVMTLVGEAEGWALGAVEVVKLADDGTLWPMGGRSISLAAVASVRDALRAGRPVVATVG